MERERVHSLTIRERRRQASRWFTLRVCLLTALIGGLAYSAWLAPWAKADHPVRVEAVP
jgi:hypothetical protein